MGDEMYEEAEVSDYEKKIAITAASLCLVNLLLAPGIAFGILLWLYLRQRNTSSELIRSHLRTAVSISVIAGMCLVLLPTILFLNPENPELWMWVIVAWTTIHGGFVVFEIYILSRAIAGLSPLP